MTDIREYVLGFAFHRSYNHKFGKTGTPQVALIFKTKGPPNLHNRWNGIGGKIEAGETGHQAMAREFKEETGLDTNAQDWRFFCTAKSDYFIMHCFTIEIDPNGQGPAPQISCEEEGGEYVAWRWVDELPTVINNNLTYLIPMALDQHIKASFIDYSNDVE